MSENEKSSTKKGEPVIIDHGTLEAKNLIIVHQK